MREKNSDVFYYLITKSEFRDWVRKPNSDSDYFWGKWMEEYPENISDLKKASEFLKRMHFRSDQLSPDELANMLEKVMAHEEYERKNGIKLENLWILFSQPIRVAAILLISVVAAIFLSPEVGEMSKESLPVETEWTTLQNSKGRKSRITLPDGTQVHLSYESQLKFPAEFNKKSRRVELIGEAYFEVFHNEAIPFVVVTDEMETEVLGTSFNIKSYKEELRTEISVITGKVKIRNQYKSALHEKAFLTPGEQLSYSRNSGEIIVRPFELEKTLAWKEDIILFEDAGLDEFVDQLERWYGVDIQIFGSPSKEWKVNGRYQNQTLEDILTGMDFVYGVEYEIRARSVILKLK